MAFRMALKGQGAFDVPKLPKSASVPKEVSDQPTASLVQASSALPVGQPTDSSMSIKTEWSDFTEEELYGLKPPIDGDEREFFKEFFIRFMEDTFKRSRQQKEEREQKQYYLKAFGTENPFELGNGYTPNNVGSTSSLFYGKSGIGGGQSNSYQPQKAENQPKPAENDLTKILENVAVPMGAEYQASLMSFFARQNLPVVNTVINETVVEVIESPSHSASYTTQTSLPAGAPRTQRSFASTATDRP